MSGNYVCIADRCLDVPEKKVIRPAKTQKVKIKNSYCQRNGSLNRVTGRHHGPNAVLESIV